MNCLQEIKGLEGRRKMLPRQMGSDARHLEIRKQLFSAGIARITSPKSQSQLKQVASGTPLAMALSPLAAPVPRQRPLGALPHGLPGTELCWALQARCFPQVFSGSGDG